MEAEKKKRVIDIYMLRQKTQHRYDFVDWYIKKQQSLVSLHLQFFYSDLYEIYIQLRH